MTIAEQEILPEHLSLAVRGMFHARSRATGPWVAATRYNPTDLVSHEGSTYICLTYHRSGSDFAADLALSRWMMFSITSAASWSDLSGIPDAINALDGLAPAADKFPYFTGAATAALADLTSYGRTLAALADAAAGRTALGLVIGTDVQAYDPDLAAIAALTSAANKVPYATGSGTWALADFTAAGRALMDDADATAQRATLGLTIGTHVQAYDATLASIAALGTAADKLAYTTGIDTWAEAAITSFGRSLIDDADATAARATLGLVIGTNVQAYDAELAALAGLTSAADKAPYFTGSGTAALADLTTFGRSLIDDADAAAARTTLGLVIGTNVQAQDAELAAIAGLASAADRLPYFTGSGTASLATFTGAARNLLDDADAATMRTTLGAQAQDGDLDALAALSGTNNIYYRSASNTWTSVTIGSLLSFAAGTLNVGDAELTALAGLTSAADKLPYFTGSGTAALADFVVGTYTPTYTNVANTSARTAYTAFYIRLGAVVFVAWTADFDPVSAATNTSVGMSLPIASNFTVLEDAAGVVVGYAAGGQTESGSITADATNDRVQIDFLSVTTANARYVGVFGYRVK